MTEKVYRGELTPVSFSRRSAYTFPDKEAVVYGGIEFRRERIARFKVPAAVEFGKVRKFVLCDAEWSGRDRKSN